MAILCTGFAERRNVNDMRKLQTSKFGVQARSRRRIGGGCLPVDFMKLHGKNKGASDRKGSIKEVQEDFIALFNGREENVKARPNQTIWDLGFPANINNAHFEQTTDPSPWPLDQVFSETTTSEDYTSQDEPHSKALARLEQLNLHLNPLFEDSSVLSCGYAQCQTLLQTQNRHIPKNFQTRACVHSGCGYVSTTAQEWRRHVLGGDCKFHEDNVERKGENLNWSEDWEGEAGRCCGV